MSKISLTSNEYTVESNLELEQFIQRNRVSIVHGYDSYGKTSALQSLRALYPSLSDFINLDSIKDYKSNSLVEFWYDVKHLISSAADSGKRYLLLDHVDKVPGLLPYSKEEAATFYFRFQTLLRNHPSVRLVLTTNTNHIEAISRLFERQALFSLSPFSNFESIIQKEVPIEIKQFLGEEALLSLSRFVERLQHPSYFNDFFQKEYQAYLVYFIASITRHAYEAQSSDLQTLISTYLSGKCYYLSSHKKPEILEIAKECFTAPNVFVLKPKKRT